MHKKNGFTLLELLTVLLIISTIALMAYPNYMSYVYKSNRVDAMNSLFHYQALWQHCMLQVQNAEDCLQAIDLAHPVSSLQKHYQISATQHQFRAEPIDNQAKDLECTVWLLENNGQMLAYNHLEQDTTVQCW